MPKSAAAVMAEHERFIGTHTKLYSGTTRRMDTEEMKPETTRTGANVLIKLIMCVRACLFVGVWALPFTENAWARFFYVRRNFILLPYVRVNSKI